MARKVDRLSARGVASLGLGLHADGGGLYLLVDQSGARRWTFIFRFAGKRREMGLGPATDVALITARQMAQDARGQVRSGVDPVDERRRQRASQTPSFGTVADALIVDLSPQWKSPIHRRQWSTTLTVDAAPLRSLPVDKVSTEDVLGTLKPIWQTKPETASRLRGRIERVLDAAKVKGLRSGDNPARWRGHLDHLLPAPGKLLRGHHPALPYDQMAAFMVALRLLEGISARALELTILTVARTDATRGAHKDEFDLDKAIWTIPKARLKRKIDHRVALSSRAIEIVRGQIAAAGADGFLFPGQQRSGKRQATISNMAMYNLLQHLGHPDITVHGFRSTFKDWCSDCTTFPNELSEIALHHAVGDQTEQAYRRGDGLKMRVQLMDAWRRFCDGETNIIALPVGFQGIASGHREG